MGNGEQVTKAYSALHVMMRQYIVAKNVLDVIFYNHRGDQIFFSATCPGQVASKNPLVLRNFLLVPKYFSNCISFGQVANTTISYSKCNSNQTVVDEGSSDL